MSTGAKPREPGWRTRDILRASAIVAGVYVALQLLRFGRTVFLLGFFGVLLGITLSAGVDRLERLRVPRGIGAVGIVLLVLGGLIGIGLLTGPQVSRQLGELRQQVPQAIDRAERWVQQRGGGVADLLQSGSESTRQPRDTTPEQEDTEGKAGKGQQDGEGQPVDLRQGITQQLAGAGRHFFSVFSSTIAALGGLLVLLFVAIFVAVDPGLYHRGLELPPVITILGQALLALVFGFMGLLLAVPLLATAMVPIKMLYVRDVVGDEVSVPGDAAG